MDNIKTIVNNVTEVFVSLLALAIVASSSAHRIWRFSVMLQVHNVAGGNT